MAQTSIPSICCSEHPNLPIQRIDPNPAVKKHAYCFECLLQTKEANSLYLALPTVSDFIANTAITFDQAKKQTNCSDGPPKEYLDVQIGRTKIFDLLVKQLEQEKRKIEDFFSEIAKSITNIINKKKDEHLKMIESQLSTFNANYTFYDKELKRAYPKQEDLDKMFPSKAELEKRLARLGTAMELDSFVNEIKENYAATKAELNIITQSESKKRLRFDGFMCNAQALEKNLPLFESKESYAQTVKDEVEKLLLKLLNGAFTLRNSIPDLCPSLDLNSIKDMLLTHENSLTLKEWLPTKYNFVPKLIYKGSRDGMTPEAFHSRCDGKGPTISLIKCHFSGSPQESVIGGFLDKDWHQKNQFIPSNEAFIFSLTLKLKCPIIQQDWAAQGYEDCGIIFGAGNDILIAKNLSESYINERSYMNTSQLIDSDTYSGSGRFYFKPIEIEVYSLV